MKLFRAFALPVAAFLALALLSGSALAALPKPAVPRVPSAGGGAKDAPESFGDLPASKGPVEYQSREGDFSTTFPSGCASLHSKMNVAEDGSTDVAVRVVFVNCDRWERKGEGCCVSAHLGALAGLTGQKATDVVLQEIRELMQSYGVSAVRQTPLARDFGPHGKVEGLEVLAQAQAGGGEVWIRGFMRGQDIYVLTAWKTDGGLFTDPEFVVFFDAFRPWVEGTE